MKKKKFTGVLATMLMAGSLLAACGNNEAKTNRQVPNQKKQNIRFV